MDITEIAKRVPPHALTNAMRYALWKQLRLPHQGMREMARRCAQAERAK